MREVSSEVVGRAGADTGTLKKTERMGEFREGV